jgi:hypothetical protein
MSLFGPDVNLILASLACCIVAAFRLGLRLCRVSACAEPALDVILDDLFELGGDAVAPQR